MVVLEAPWALKASQYSEYISIPVKLNLYLLSYGESAM